MNVFGVRERSWRKAREQGVSPIIATILLVAITVVLAAVLYVLISGLTSGGANTVPIGTTFAFGTAQQTSSPPTTGGTPYVCGVAAPAAGTCYAVSVQSAGSSATTANIHFGALKSGTGQTFVTVSIFLPGATTAAATYTYSTGAWTGNNLPLSLSSVDTIIVYGGATSWAGMGYSLEAIGVGSLSGTVTTALP
jgi:flagellin-like protein